MESFYRQMRVRHQVLMDGNQPVGAQWNFDHDNRKPVVQIFPKTSGAHILRQIAVRTGNQLKIALHFAVGAERTGPVIEVRHSTLPVAASSATTWAKPVPAAISVRGRRLSRSRTQSPLGRRRVSWAACCITSRSRAEFPRRLFCQELAVLLDAGIPLYEALASRWALQRLHAQALQALGRAPLDEATRARLRQQLLDLCDAYRDHFPQLAGLEKELNHAAG